MCPMLALTRGNMSWGSDSNEPAQLQKKLSFARSKLRYEIFYDLIKGADQTAHTSVPLFFFVFFKKS